MKNYVAPVAELVMFAATETIASSYWGSYKESSTASMNGIKDIWDAPWKYDDGRDAF